MIFRLRGSRRMWDIGTPEYRDGEPELSDAVQWRALYAAFVAVALLWLGIGRWM